MGRGVAEARNFAASAGIDQGDRLWTKVRGEKRAVGGECALHGTRGADRAGKTPDQGASPGIPAGEGIQVSGKDPRPVGMEANGGFIKSGWEQLEPGVSRGVPNDDPGSFFLGCCDESGIRVDRYGIK